MDRIRTARHRGRRVVLPVLTALATAAALVAVQFAVASSRDIRPHFALDLQLGTPVAADGETVTAVVRLTMADMRPGETVTVTGRLSGGLRTVGADPSRGGFDGPSGVWTMPAAQGTHEAVLLWRLQATAGAPGAAEHVRVTVTSPQTRAARAGTASASASGSTSGRPSRSAGGAKPGGSGKPGTSGKPAATGPVATRSASPSAPASPVRPTGEARPTKSAQPTASATPSTKPTATPTTKPTTQPPSPSKPPPPPPPSGVDVPAAQRCPDDTASACADLAFGKPSLRLARSANITDAKPGETVVHTVSVTDSGDAAALFANVRNSLPAGAPLLWGRLSQGTYDVTTGVWETGRIAAGGTATLTLGVRVPDPAAGTVMAARSDFVASSDPAAAVEGPCPDDPDAACASTRITGT
ncbi:MAG: DUF11 domain-containing protein [Streptomycetaceae bacterium]|nr:DUF11 domain-containing protein [Streptomycetaceae bacterium]